MKTLQRAIGLVATILTTQINAAPLNYTVCVCTDFSDISSLFDYSEMATALTNDPTMVDVSPGVQMPQGMATQMSYMFVYLLMSGFPAIVLRDMLTIWNEGTGRYLNNGDGVQLHLALYDSQAVVLRRYQTALMAVQEHPDLFAFTTSQQTTTEVAVIAQLYSKVVLTMGSSFVTRPEYPYITIAEPSAQAWTETWPVIMQLYGWKKLCHIHGEDDSSSMINELLLRNSIEVDDYATHISTREEVYDSIVFSDIRVILHALEFPLFRQYDYVIPVEFQIFKNLLQGEYQHMCTSYIAVPEAMFHIYGSGVILNSLYNLGAKDTWNQELIDWDNSLLNSYTDENIAYSMLNMKRQPDNRWPYDWQTMWYLLKDQIRYTVSTNNQESGLPMWPTYTHLLNAAAKTLQETNDLDAQALTDNIRSSSTMQLGLNLTFNAQGNANGNTYVLETSVGSSFRELVGSFSHTNLFFQAVRSPLTMKGTDVKPPMQPTLTEVSTTYNSATLLCESMNLRGLPVLSYKLSYTINGTSLDVNMSAKEITLAINPDVVYNLSCIISTDAGASPPSSVLSVTASTTIDCHVEPCKQYAACPVSADDTVCTCVGPFAIPVAPIRVTRQCSLQFIPCHESGGCLGTYGTCDTSSGICQCASGTEIAGLPPGTTGVAITQAFIAAGLDSSDAKLRTCVLAIASTDETRKFWTISLWLSAWGLLASLWVIWEFIFNKQLKYPNTMMQAFISFAVPDFLLSLMNFVVYMDSLVDGNPLGSVTGEGGRDDDGCLTVSFLMYTIVTCTYFAPTVVALVTFLKFNAVAQGKAAFALPSVVVYVMAIAFPTAIGASLAGGALNALSDDNKSVLGSYRGLYCYVRRWDDVLTGLTIIVLFCISVFFTMVLYLLTTLKVAAIVKNASSAGAANAPKALMRRGIMLTATFVFTWIWFVTTGGIAYDGGTIEIDYDMTGAIILNAQPIIDACILLTLPNIRMDFLSRWLKRAGGNISSSSSSSSSSFS